MSKIPKTDITQFKKYIKKMRTTKELLQILLNNKCYFENGLCVLAFNLWYNKIISEKEYLYIKKIFTFIKCYYIKKIIWIFVFLDKR